MKSINHNWFVSGISIVLMVLHWGLTGQSQTSKEEAIMKHSCKNMTPLQLRGKAKKLIGDIQGALNDYSDAVNQNPTNLSTYGCRAVLRLQTGDYIGAVEDMNKAIEISNKCAPCYSIRGNAKSKLGDIKGSKADFKKAKRYNKMPKIYRYIEYVNPCFSCGGESFVRSTEYTGEICNCSYQAAVNDYSRQLESNPSETGTYVFRAKARMKIEDFQGAVDDFTIALLNKPFDTVLSFLRADAKYNARDYQGALEDCNVLTSNGIEAYDLYLLIGNIRRDMKNLLEAAAAYEKSLAILKSAKGTRVQLFIVYTTRGKMYLDNRLYHEAILDYTAALEIGINECEVRYYRGLTFKAIGNKIEACKDFSQCLSNLQVHNIYEDYCK